MQYAGHYQVVFTHLTKTRKWDLKKAHEFLRTKSWSVILRINNFLVRQKILKDYDYYEVRGDKVWVANLRRGSSFVIKGDKP